MLKPGDTALAIDVLHRDKKIREMAARDYEGHPAADNYEKMVNETRAKRAQEDADAIGRVIEALAALSSLRESDAMKALTSRSALQEASIHG